MKTRTPAGSAAPHPEATRSYTQTIGGWVSTLQATVHKQSRVDQRRASGSGRRTWIPDTGRCQRSRLGLIHSHDKSACWPRCLRQAPADSHGHHQQRPVGRRGSRRWRRTLSPPGSHTPLRASPRSKARHRIPVPAHQRSPIAVKVSAVAGGKSTHRPAALAPADASRRSPAQNQPRILATPESPGSRDSRARSRLQHPTLELASSRSYSREINATSSEVNARLTGLRVVFSIDQLLHGHRHQGLVNAR